MRDQDDSNGSRRRRIGAALAALAAIAASGGWIMRSVPGEAASAPPDVPASEPASSTPGSAGKAAHAVARSPIPQHAETGVATRPLPPRGAPLVEAFDELKARADAGEAAAASRLYHDVHACYAMQHMQRYIAASYLLQDDKKELSPDELKSRDQQLKYMQDELQQIRANATLCAGVTDQHIEALIPAALRAAQLGDVKAIDCYVGMSFDMMPGLLDHPEWLADIKQNTAPLYEFALQHGDWVAVELMHHAYAGVFADTPGGQTFAADPALDYRMLRLEQLGARDGRFAAKVDRELAHVGAGLTSQQIAAADAWANETYARYFNGTASDEVSNGANICQTRDD